MVESQVTTESNSNYFISAFHLVIKDPPQTPSGNQLYYTNHTERLTPKADFLNKWSLFIEMISVTLLAVSLFITVMRYSTDSASVIIKVQTLNKAICCHGNVRFLRGVWTQKFTLVRHRRKHLNKWINRWWMIAPNKAFRRIWRLRFTVRWAVASSTAVGILLFAHYRCD